MSTSTLSQTVLNKYKNEIFFETGTHHGAGVQLAINAGFKKIYTIEISPQLVEENNQRFKTEIEQGLVEIILGDSYKIMPDILKKIDARTTFWLDGHWDPPQPGRIAPSGQFNCPLPYELKYISQHHIKDHTLLIDDRRLFGDWSHHWGREINESQILQEIAKINSGYKISYEDGCVAEDIIVAYI